ncbi:hypothetical protein IWW50_001117 [Coemansia erecta]|nr:hypothetical protein IWW50_001117 [Coemansia erecta]
MSAKQQYVAKNGKGRVSVDAQIPISLLRLLFGNEDSDDGNKVDARSFMTLAYEGRFMLLEWPSAGTTECQLVSMGNDVAMAGETITALYCMDIYTPQTHTLAQTKQQRGVGSICVVAGYSSGYMRVFSAYGHLLTAHQFHPQRLLRIRLRMPVQAHNDYSAWSTVDDGEEVNLTYQDGTMISVDGRSLYLALRLCLNEAAMDEADGPMFQYKKWAFDLNTPRVSDAVNYGPATCRDPLAQLAKSAYMSSPLLSDATARFLVAPHHGDAAFGVFITNEDAAPTFSAVDIAGKMAAKVTGAVLNIAKSYFWRSNPSATAESSGQSTPSRAESSTLVSCALAHRDSPRKVLAISLAPAQYALAALTDSLGRVMLFDLESCEVVHMLKGQRGSQCAWMEVTTDGVQHMYVVVYAAKRGVVEVYGLGMAEQPLASVSVGLGWTLVQCPTQPLGGSLVVGSAGTERRATQPTPASCMLLSDSGRIARISI